MNKKSHMLLTKKMSEMMPIAYNKFLQIGCILPDILVHTYLRGHTWDTSGKRTLKRLEELEEWGILNSWYSLSLGVLLHYLEDYFTMAHSKYFKGDIREHIHYEKQLLFYINDFCQGNNERIHFDKLYIEVRSAAELSERIILLQNKYQQEILELADDEKRCYEIDLKYMSIVVQSVLEYVVPMMNEKTILYRKLAKEAIIKMPQGYGTL